MVESFWSTPDVTNVRVPLRILHEQSAALADQTKGTLIGSVVVGQDVNGAIFLGLDLFVPTLSDYRYRILTYQPQPVDIYPGRLKAPWGKFEQIRDDAAFISSVRTILSSKEAREVLTLLLEQAKESRTSWIAPN